MPITDSYATAVYYRNIVKSTDAGDDSQILDDLTAMSRYLDRLCDRAATGFNQDAAPVARVYYPKGYFSGDPESENPWRGVRSGRQLDVDDIATATGLSIVIDSNRTGVFTGYTPLAATDYQLLPLNANLGPEPKPWNVIFLPTWSTQQGWPPGCPVQVTATFGWPAVPKAIKDATCQLTGILRLESPRATSMIPEGIDKALGESPSAQRIIGSILTAYKRERIYA